MSDRELGRRLQATRMEMNLTQIELAKRAGVSQSTIANVESGRNAGTKFVVRIADALGVNVRWLTEGQLPRYGASLGQFLGAEPMKAEHVLTWEQPSDLPEDPDRVWIDRFDYRVSAGNGHIQWEIREKHALPFTKKFFKAIGSRPDDCRLLDVHGDSMEPFLFDRDMIMIDVTKTAPREGKIYALQFQDEALVKQIFKESGGTLRLHSYNGKYPDKLIPLEHLENVKLIGECVYRSGSTLNI